MKVYVSLLALSALCSNAAAWAPNQTPSFQRSATALSSSRETSYLTNINGGESDVASPGTSGGLQSTQAAVRSPRGSGPDVNDMWDQSTPTIIQGSSLQTWSFAHPSVERVQVLMKTEGRPLNANVELWQGPDNTPQKMGVYIEDGSTRPFNCVIETPRGSNSIAIRNTGQLEFPLAAACEADMGGPMGLGAVISRLSNEGKPRIVQGGAVHTYPFNPAVASVQIALKTDGRPLNARIELLQGPNNIKQVIELYTEDGLDRPFFAVIETPGSGNVVRIVNTATVEFPLTATVEPYMVDPNSGGAYGDDGRGYYASGGSYSGGTGGINPY